MCKKPCFRSGAGIFCLKPEPVFEKREGNIMFFYFFGLFLLELEPEPVTER